jgi:HD-like signal output (HDOD) protein
VPVVNPDKTYFRNQLAALMEEAERLPHLPMITIDIRHALESPSIAAVPLSRLIAQDPVISKLLLRYASSVMLNRSPPQDVFEAVRILGMLQVERIIMVHSMRTLFSGHTQSYTRLFTESWDRLVQKAAISALIAKKVGGTAPDKALLGSLLSEVGSLVVLSAFKSPDQAVPSREIYVDLCREFAKSLGIMLLKKWELEDEYAQLLREVGNWNATEDEPLGLIDVVNLGLYHSLKSRMTAQRLPAISSLIAYQKLPEKHNAITDTNELELVVLHRDEIHAMVDSLY